MINFAIYVIFNSISVISGPWLHDSERLCSMEHLLWLERFLPQVGLESGTARSVGQHLATELMGLHMAKEI